MDAVTKTLYLRSRDCYIPAIHHMLHLQEKLVFEYWPLSSAERNTANTNKNKKERTKLKS